MEFLKAISSSSNQVIIRIHVTPGVVQNCFPAGYNIWRRCIEAKIAADPKDNQANKKLIRVVADFFHIPTGNVFLVTGEKNREKILALKNISEVIVTNKLTEAFHGL